jgi:predicted amidohydrolase
MARVATVRFGEPRDPLTLEGQRDRIAGKLDEAGALRPDIVCLTEFCHLAGVPSGTAEWVSASEPVPDGPLCQVLAEKAQRHAMHVVCGLAERDGAYVYNTAVLFGRDGRLLGRYRKTHLTFAELAAGVSPGADYPVFALDFGRVAVLICYDEWFPEVARAYAQAGAEVLFLPVVGGKPITWRTRALDNGVYFVSSSWTPPSMIIDSSGAVLAETHSDGIAYADLDLRERRVNWYVDPTVTYGMPTIAPEMRNVLDDGLLAMLAEQWGV